MKRPPPLKSLRINEKTLTRILAIATIFAVLLTLFSTLDFPNRWTLLTIDSTRGALHWSMIFSSLLYCLLAASLFLTYRHIKTNAFSLRSWPTALLSIAFGAFSGYLLPLMVGGSIFTFLAITGFAVVGAIAFTPSESDDTHSSRTWALATAAVGAVALCIISLIEVFRLDVHINFAHTPVILLLIVLPVAVIGVTALCWFFILSHQGRTTIAAALLMTTSIFVVTTFTQLESVEIICPPFYSTVYAGIPITTVGVDLPPDGWATRETYLYQSRCHARKYHRAALSRSRR